VEADEPVVGVAVVAVQQRVRVLQGVDSIILGQYSVTCSNYSTLRQKSSVSKFVCSIAKYFVSSEFNHFYITL
jgi:hypothetical protein